MIVNCHIINPHPHLYHHPYPHSQHPALLIPPLPRRQSAGIMIRNGTMIEYPRPVLQTSGYWTRTLFKCRITADSMKKVSSCLLLLLFLFLSLFLLFFVVHGRPFVFPPLFRTPLFLSLLVTFSFLKLPLLPKSIKACGLNISVCVCMCA